MLIGEPLADEARKDTVGPLPVIATERHAVAVAEIKLCEIAVKVLFRAPLINALHAALEDAEIAFNRVRVDAATPVFAERVIDRSVAQEIVVKALLVIVPRFVRKNVSLAVDIGVNETATGRRWPSGVWITNSLSTEE